MIAGLVAAAFAVGATGASVRRLRRIATATSADADALARALGLSADRTKLSKVADAARAAGARWEADLLDATLSARTERERIALVNEALHDLESTLAWGAALPASAARICLLGAFGALFLTLARDGPTASPVVQTVAWGAAGFAASLSIGREADRIAADVRAGVDRLVARALAAAAREGGEAPAAEPATAVDHGGTDV